MKAYTNLKLFLFFVWSSSAISGYEDFKIFIHQLFNLQILGKSLRFTQRKASPMAEQVRICLQCSRQETRVWYLGGEDTLEKEKAIHSSILAWKIPSTERLGRIKSVGLQRVGHAKSWNFWRMIALGQRKILLKKMLFILIPDQLKVFWDQDLGVYPIERSCNRHPFGPVHSFPVSQSIPWPEQWEDSLADPEFSLGLNMADLFFQLIWVGNVSLYKGLWTVIFLWVSQHERMDYKTVTLYN